MKTKLSVLGLLSVALLSAGGYYLAEYIKLEQVDNQVKAWKTRLGDYITFEYDVISARLWSNSISLERVLITYPTLMSIEKLTFAPVEIDGELEQLYIDAKGLSFTVPAATDSLAWYGNLQIDYQYDSAKKQIDLTLLSDFPQLLNGEIKTTLQEITPNIDLVFSYPNVLLSSLSVQFQNYGLLQTMGYGNSNDAELIEWMNQFAQKNQRQAFADFWLKNMPLNIQFSPEYPVPLYRLLENDRLFWQHPAVIMQPLPG